MNGFTEPLPGLLDDPQFQIPNLPSLPDVRIAPLRNPAPRKHGKAPLPLEPLTKPSEDRRQRSRNTNPLQDESEKISPPRLTPNDVLSAREAKKPHLAISELLETNNEADSQHFQLPSFVSLAVVERSPVQEPSHLSPHKRIRLDLDVDIASRDVARRLPRPAQKDDKQARPVPLLPAMVTGLHEPPPSARILPSMDLDGRPNAIRTSKSSKMQVKDMLTEARRSSTHVPPEAMLNTPDMSPRELTKPQPDSSMASPPADAAEAYEHLVALPKKDAKTRRARRKWSEAETTDLLAGVKRHGFGKWKQILNDTAYTFQERTSIDLKDRYRVYVKDQPDSHASTAPLQNYPSMTSYPYEREVPRSGDTTNMSGDVVRVMKPKRKRRPWTPAEDDGLLRGVSKHGFQWTAIHDDVELNLTHRRATDLRDRIRNLFPEGYKQAEVRPLKSEARKEEKLAQSNDSPQADAKAKTLTDDATTVAQSSQENAARQSSSPQTKPRAGRSRPTKSGGDILQSSEQIGVTLPSLALDDDDELDWGNNTLPPLLEWEEIGI